MSMSKEFARDYNMSQRLKIPKANIQSRDIIATCSFGGFAVFTIIAGSLVLTVFNGQMVEGRTLRSHRHWELRD